MHLHDERLVLLLPLAGVLVVLEREGNSASMLLHANLGIEES